MPHITVSLYPGYPEEARRALAQKLKEDAVEILGAENGGVSVRLRTVPGGRWKAEVYDPEVRGAGEDELYIPPGYAMDDE